MSFQKLVSAFEGHENMPILVDDVRDWLIENQFQDEINFYNTSSDANILRGVIAQYHVHNGVYDQDPRRVTDIGISSKQSLCWRRFTALKEMLHIVDSPQLRTSTAEQIERLALELFFPDLKQVKSPDVMCDLSAPTRALMVMAPMPMIDDLRSAYQDGVKSNYELAKFFMMPEFYIDFIFSPEYRILYDLVMNPEKIIQLSAQG